MTVYTMVSEKKREFNQLSDRSSRYRVVSLLRIEIFVLKFSVHNENFMMFCGHVGRKWNFFTAAEISLQIVK